MPRRYWLQLDGRKLYGTLGQVHAAAGRLARQVGDAVQVGWDDAPAGRRYRSNPDPGSYLAFWRAQEAAREDRRQYVARTKPARLAKGLRGRPGAPPAPATPRYAVSVANRRESYTLGAATKAAAKRLQADYEAAGYRVTIQPV